MSQANKIYTRGGDNGETSLLGGARVTKDSPRVEAYGEIDELNSHIGAARALAEAAGRSPLPEFLCRIQSDLFSICSCLASDAASLETPCNLSREDLRRLETWIDQFAEELPALSTFIFPGGTMLNSALHLCRAVCRRAERRVVALSHMESVPNIAVAYLNRLSDLLFTMARYESAKSGVPESQWQVK